MAKGKKKQNISIEVLSQQVLVPLDEQPYEVPENWVWVYGKDSFGQIESKKPSGDYFKYIDIESIDNKSQKVLEPKKIAVSEAPSRASRKLHNGDTLFSLVRPYLRNIAYIDSSLSDCIASTGFYVCHPNEVFHGRYIYYLMTSEYIVNGLNAYMKGDNSPSIRKDDIENFAFPLPPIAEQRRIVSRIESLFIKLDQAMELTQIALATFETRKAAILHKAFTGELTAKWREKHGVGVEGWESKPLLSIADIVSGFAFKSQDFGIDHEIPCVKITNVGVGTYQYNDADDSLPISFLSHYKRFIVKEKDILISLTRSFINSGLKVCIYSESTMALLNQRVALIRYSNIKYLYYYLRTSDVLNYVKEKSKTTNQPNLSIKDLEKMLIPFPSLSEQQEIVRILDSLLGNEQKVEELCNVIDNIDLMKKAILARAFRGELGTNDPAEESAVELLKDVLANR